MPDISKIKLPGDNNTYDISDLVARGLLLEISQDDYNDLVQAGTVDPDVYYYIYDAAGTELPIDTSLDTTSSNAIANGPVASFAQAISQSVSYKMDKANPTGTGSLSLNRSGTTGTESVSIGHNCVASGVYSYAEGMGTTSSGNTSHAEGYQTTSSGFYSHAEGWQTTASGTESHAEGDATQATGDFSHTEGMGTIAQRKSQHVFGEYNIADTGGTAGTTKGNYIEIVGKGANTNSRSNARTLDWNGNEVLAGGLKLHGTEDASCIKSFTNDITTTADGLAAVTIPSGVGINNIFAIIVQNPSGVYLYGFLIKQPSALWADIRQFNGTAYASQDCTIRLFYYVI